MRRRDFLKGLGGFLALGGLEKESEARGRERGVCSDTRERSIGALKNACAPGAFHDPEVRMMLREALHSSASFAELSRFVDLNTKEKGVMRVLYPGAGSHLAPLYMAAKLMDGGKIESAEFTFTDINECKQMELEENLSNLAKVDPNFVFYSDKTQFKLNRSDSDGVETVYQLEYKGHLIRLRFCLGCSGEAFYRESDFETSDVFVIHDPGGYGNQDTLDLLSEYFESQPGSQASSTVILDDLTRFSYPKRAFDLELLGVIHHGRNPYGHRKKEHTPLSHFSKAQACRTKEYYEGSSYSPKQDDLVRWKKEGVAPEAYMFLSTETGEAEGSGAALLPHPVIRGLNPRLSALLIDIDLAANNESVFNFGITVRDRLRMNASLYSGKAPDLFSPSFLKDLFENGHRILPALQSVHPKLAEGLVIRMVQLLIKLDSNLIPSYVREYHSDRPEEGFKEILAFFDSLPIPNQGKLKPYFKMLRNYLLDHQKNYVLWLNKEDLRQKGTTFDELDAGRLEWENGFRVDDEARVKAFKKLYKYGNQIFESVRF